MIRSTITARSQAARLIFAVVLTLSLTVFVGQFAYGGPECGAKTNAAGCTVKSCDAKTTCDKAAAIKANTEPETKKNKEEFISKCLALGMDQEQAEACWVTYAEGKTKTSATATTSGCPLAKQAAATGQTPANCPGMVKTADATTGEHKTCTKEECVAKLMAQGLTKEAAEAKYAACVVDGKCTGKCGTDKTGCTITTGGKK